MDIEVLSSHSQQPADGLHHQPADWDPHFNMEILSEIISFSIILTSRS